MSSSEQGRNGVRDAASLYEYAVSALGILVGRGELRRQFVGVDLGRGEVGIHAGHQQLSPLKSFREHDDEDVVNGIEMPHTPAGAACRSFSLGGSPKLIWE